MDAASGEILRRHLELIYSKPYFEIEATTMCNLNCTFCPRDRLTRKSGVMGINTFSHVLKEIPPNSKVMFSGFGEPTLNPNLLFFLLELKKRGNCVGLTTNGLNMNASFIGELCEIGVDVVQISIFTTNPQIYSGIMKRGDVEVVLSNIEVLQDLKRENTRIQLSILEGEKIPRCNDIISYAKNHEISVFRKPLHSRGGFLYKPDRGDLENVCGIFTKITYVAWNGDILACCQDLTGGTRLGNLTKEKLAEILNRKEKVISENGWYEICKYCDDPFRFILFNDSTDLE